MDVDRSRLWTVLSASTKKSACSLYPWCVSSLLHLPAADMLPDACASQTADAVRSRALELVALFSHLHAFSQLDMPSHDDSAPGTKRTAVQQGPARLMLNPWPNLMLCHVLHTMWGHHARG